MKRDRIITILCSLPLAAAISVMPATAGSKAVNFSTQIKPVLKAKCYSCHKPGKAKGELDLTTKTGIQKGGSEGKLYKAGKGAESLLVKRLKGIGGDIMPQDDKPLSEAQIKLVTRWINEGAKF